MSSFLYIVLGIITGILSLLLGGTFSFIIVAFLTTRNDESEIETGAEVSDTETS